MTPFKKFVPVLARFRHDETGNVALLTAFCALPLIVAACGSVDVLRMTATQERLQIMLDSATLASASLTQSGAITDVVDEYMTANQPDGAVWDTLSYTTTVVDDSLSSKEVTITASVKLKTPFLSLIGQSEQTVRAESTAVQAQTEIEISMVLDISSSMKGAKLTDLKSSSKEFIDLMLDGDLADQTSINLVLFGGTVNIGSTLFDKYAVPSSPSNTDPPDSYYQANTNVPYLVSRFSAGNTCIEYQDKDFSLTAIGGKSHPQVPDFTRYGAKNDWCPRTDTESMFNSNSAADLKSRIDGMSLSDGTGMDIGTMWGAKALSPNLRGELGGDFADRPADFDDSNTMKIAVIMTDGEITEQVRPKSPTSGVKPHLDRGSLRQTIVDKGSTSVDPATTYNAMAYYKRMCDLMRSNGVYVYTIGYKITSGSAPDTLLKYCAKSPSDYYHVEGFDLSSAFNGIAASINSLRISG